MQKGIRNIEFDAVAIADYFDVARTEARIPVAPDQTLFVPGDGVYAIVHDTQAERVLTSFLWGFNPARRSLYNTKIETASMLFTWEDSFRHRRCVLPFNSVANTGMPNMSADSRSVLAVAAIFDQSNVGVSVLTTQTRGSIDRRAHRIPLLVPEHLIDAWLDRDNTNPDLLRRRINNEASHLSLAL
jgi:putative SOS response-associated peptidase YedK